MQAARNTQSLALNISTAEEVTGGEVKVSVKYGIIPVFSDTLALCDVLKDAKMSCPLKPESSASITLSQEVPGGIPGVSEKSWVMRQLLTVFYFIHSHTDRGTTLERLKHLTRKAQSWRVLNSISTSRTGFELYGVLHDYVVLPLPLNVCLSSSPLLSDRNAMRMREEACSYPRANKPV